MPLIQHGCRRGLLLGKRADLSHGVFVVSSRLSSCLRSHCERIGLGPREDKGGLGCQLALRSARFGRAGFSKGLDGY
jgi:hypothetical protein